MRKSTKERGKWWTEEDLQVKSWVDLDMHKLATELGKFERVKHYIIKRTSFSIEEGEMTPTMKIKRKVVEQKYAQQIKDMYSNIVE